MQFSPAGEEEFGSELGSELGYFFKLGTYGIYTAYKPATDILY